MDTGCITQPGTEPCFYYLQITAADSDRLSLYVRLFQHFDDKYFIVIHVA